MWYMESNMLSAHEAVKIIQRVVCGAWLMSVRKVQEPFTELQYRLACFWEVYLNTVSSKNKSFHKWFPKGLSIFPEVYPVKPLGVTYGITMTWKVSFFFITLFLLTIRGMRKWLSCRGILWNQKYFHVLSCILKNSNLKMNLFVSSLYHHDLAIFVFESTNQGEFIFCS